MSVSADTDVSEILERCLREIEKQHASIEDCVRRYPEYPELNTLLRLRSHLGSLEDVSMNPMRTHLLEQRLMNKFDHLIVPQQAKPSVSRSWFGSMRVLRSVAAICFVIIFGIFIGIGTISVAGNAIPGDSLYGIKRAAERVELQMASSEWRQMLTYNIASRRLDEGTQLVLRGKPLDDAFIEEIHIALNAAPLNAISLTPIEEKLTKQASYLADLLKQQPSLPVAMSNLAGELTTFAAAAPTAIVYPTVVAETTKPPIIPTETGVDATAEGTEVDKTHVPPTSKPTQIKPTSKPTQIRPQPTARPTNPSGNGNGNGNGNSGKGNGKP